MLLLAVFMGVSAVIGVDSTVSFSVPDLESTVAASAVTLIFSAADVETGGFESVPVSAIANNFFFNDWCYGHYL